MKKLMLSLFIAFGLSGCSLGNDDINMDCGTNTDVPFAGYPLLCNYAVKTLPNNPVAAVVTSEEQMTTLFTKHENTCPVATDPTIDFSKNMLIGIFAGVKATSGYSIKMTSVVQNNCEIVINYFESGPQSGETTSSTPTYPSDFILIPKSSKTIIFNKTNESPDNIIIGSYYGECTGSDCQNFFQLNDFNILKLVSTAPGNFNFEQSAYFAKTKRNEYTTFGKLIPAEIYALKGQTKTYGSPDAADQGGIFFQLKQGASTTKIFIDNNDTPDQSEDIKTFKKAIKDKITSLK
ncbi:protease complex subunit PrcB family protein [Flavobacterium sp. KACC 22761]|uniref:protease complex subunit PrcB family protein n=1 Tax=Flavobacterium sp. KACC 22761 TaxID=3092665 RepID=UPI002A755BF9|nr:protease complex subunit PrcB family protein [Flavobacterium sp. KACC 22761]WPO79233.1 protease complex subunit PrcB family protein [Flavobacterium sp. KACC 22761]